MRWNLTDLPWVQVIVWGSSLLRIALCICLPWCLTHSWPLYRSKKEEDHCYPGIEVTDQWSNALWWRLATFEHCLREKWSAVALQPLLWFFVLIFSLDALLLTPILNSNSANLQLCVPRYASWSGLWERQWAELSRGWTGMCSSQDKRLI